MLKKGLIELYLENMLMAIISTVTFLSFIHLEVYTDIFDIYVILGVITSIISTTYVILFILYNYIYKYISGRGGILLNLWKIKNNKRNFIIFI